jgi:hypothetical protein
MKMEPSAFLVGEKRLNGMITNDQFCCPRWGQLQLSWWRRPLRLRSGADPEPREIVSDARRQKSPGKGVTELGCLPCPTDCSHAQSVGGKILGVRSLLSPPSLESHAEISSCVQLFSHAGGIYEDTRASAPYHGGTA